MNELGISTLEKFKKYLKLKNYSDKTIKCYSNCLLVFLKIIKNSGMNATSNDYNVFMNSFEFSSYQQQNQYISSLKIFYEKILNKKFLKANFTRPRNENHLPRVIDSDLLKEKIINIKNLKHKSIISLSYSVGLRVSEVINLKIEDIDSKKMIIYIKNGKGKKDRIVPLSQNVLDILRKYYIEFKPIEYLFNGQNSLQYSSNSCNQLMKKYFNKNYHFHLLRHSCFTHLIENGTDCRVIQKIAGHKNIKTTEGYMHVSNKVIKSVKLPI
jgi:site-specific recombinase XerD